MAVVHAALCSERRWWKKVSTSVGKSFNRREKKLQRVRVVTLRVAAGGTVVLRWTCYGGGTVLLLFCWNQYKQYCYNQHNDLMQPARAATGGIFHQSSKARCWNRSVRHATTGTTACWNHPRRGLELEDDGYGNRRRPELKVATSRQCCNLRGGSGK